MKPRALTGALLVLAATLWACAGGPETGPGEVRWDRETCARCRMAVSDRHHAAQVRGWPTERRSELFKFDDLGCAVIWLEQQPWGDDPRVELWVTAHRGGRWLDASSAWFVKGLTTPMDYGLGAQEERVDGALGFEQAVAHVHEVQVRLDEHRSSRHPRPPARGTPP